MLSSCGQAQSPQQNIFFLCAVAGEDFLTERAVNLPNHALLSLRGAHNPGVNIISSIEIFRYSKELVAHRQPTSGTEGCGDSLGRGKLRSAASPGARLLFHDSPRACRSPDQVPFRPYSRCVGRPAFIDSSDLGGTPIIHRSNQSTMYSRRSMLCQGSPERESSLERSTRFLQ